VLASPVPLQMRPGRALPVPAPMWAGATPVRVQMSWGRQVAVPFHECWGKPSPGADVAENPGPAITSRMDERRIRRCVVCGEGQSLQRLWFAMDPCRQGRSKRRQGVSSHSVHLSADAHIPLPLAKRPCPHWRRSIAPLALTVSGLAWSHLPDSRCGPTKTILAEP
jgi:hypothetical protein